MRRGISAIRDAEIPRPGSSPGLEMTRRVCASRGSRRTMEATSKEAAARHLFGRFVVLPLERRLLADGKPVAVGPRAFDVLLVLIERPGRLVTKDELLERVWPKLVVEENNLQVQVSSLRKVIGQDAIATIPLL